MDKFEMEQLSQLGDLVTELQLCFIDDDAYSRTPSAREWRTASRIAHRLKLLICELRGYATACRQYEIVSIRERLRVASGNKGGDAEPNEPNNQKENPDVELSGLGKGFIKFTEKEILSMPKEKRKYFKINGIRAPFRKRPNGVFEIRCRINGENFYGAAIDINIAKKRFIEDLKRAKPKETAMLSVPSSVPTFEAYAYHYLETFKKNYICEKAYNNYYGQIKRNIAPSFAGKLINEITSTACQAILNKFETAGKYRTLEDINNLLKWICTAAVGDGYLQGNPMQNVIFLKHGRTQGKCIPVSLVREQLLTLPQCAYDYAILFALFTGVRPCEINSARFLPNDFVEVKDGKKRKNESATFRKIPLHSYLLPYKDALQEFLPKVDVRNASRHFCKAKSLNGYQFKDLRHTFTTVIQECHAKKEWVDYVTNHVAAQNVTTRIYTHWSDDFAREQMEKLKF